MFGIMTTSKKRDLLIAAIDEQQGKMTERGSLSSNAEKLGKQILRVFRNEISAGQPATEGKNILFSFTTGSGSDQMKELTSLLSKEGATKSITDLNAAFNGAIKIEKKQDNTYVLTLKTSKG